MKLVKFEVNAGANKHEVEFICTARDTRHGFAHDSVMFVDNVQWCKGTCFYLNRTWESWNYQSACIEAVSREVAGRKELLRTRYKVSHGIQRMTKKHTELFNKLLAADPDIAFMKDVKEVLLTRSF